MTTPAVRAVRVRYPQAVLSMLVCDGSRPVVETNPHIDDILSFPDDLLVWPRLLPLFRLIRNIRKGKFDCVISFSRSALVHFLAFCTGSPVRMGLDWNGSGFPLTHRICDKRSAVADNEQYAVRDYLDIVAALGAKSDNEQMEFHLRPDDGQRVNAFLRTCGVQDGDLVVGLFPGGGRNSAEMILAKRWKATQYARLADQLIEKLDVKVMVLGGPQDKEIVSQVLGAMDNEAVNGCGIGNLNAFGHLLKRCAVLVTNDSLPLHLALSLKIPTVALFGPTNAKALTPHVCGRLETVQSPMECSPCYWKGRYPGCKKFHTPQCMDAISVQDVFSATGKMLKFFS